MYDAKVLLYVLTSKASIFSSKFAKLRKILNNFSDFAMFIKKYQPNRLLELELVGIIT